MKNNNESGMDLVTAIGFIFGIFTGLSRSNDGAVKVWKEYLMYFVRSLTPNMRYSERFDILLKASARGGDYSRNFAAFGIECIAKAIGYGNPQLTEEIMSRSGAFTLEEGQSITLTKGESADDHFYTVEKINGMFSVTQEGKKAILSIDTRNYLLQHDLHKQLFILQVQTRAEVMHKYGYKYDPNTDGIVGTIKLINKLISSGTPVYYGKYNNIWDCLLYKDSNNEYKIITRAYYKWGGNNLIAIHMRGSNPYIKKYTDDNGNIIKRIVVGKELNIHYVETYNRKEAGETIIICGEYK